MAHRVAGRSTCTARPSRRASNLPAAGTTQASALALRAQRHSAARLMHFSREHLRGPMRCMLLTVRLRRASSWLVSAACDAAEQAFNAAQKSATTLVNNLPVANPTDYYLAGGYGELAGPSAAISLPEDVACRPQLCLGGP